VIVDEVERMAVAGGVGGLDSDEEACADCLEA
jgi:hypothetical protein